MALDFEQLASSLEAIAESEELQSQIAANHALRRRLVEACRHGMLTLEEPWDGFRRYFFLGFERSVAKVGVDLGLWDVLVRSNEPMHINELATSTGTEPSILARLLRFAAAYDMVRQVDVSQYQASNGTRALALKGLQDAVTYSNDVLAPAIANLASHLKKTNYAESVSPVDTAWTDAFKYSGPFFEWIATQPDKAQAFHGAMAFQRYGISTWLEKFPLEKYLDLDSPTRVQFVDVAGGNGFQALNVLKRFPELRGKVVLEELENLGALSDTEPQGLVPVAFDLFDAQPLKNAKVYYLRNVLHDWPDDKCREILARLRDAIDQSSSVILIDELVIPDQVQHWYPSSYDLTMFVMGGAKERSLSEWDSLFQSCGMRRVDVVQYDAHGTSIQVLVKSGQKSENGESSAITSSSR